MVKVFEVFLIYLDDTLQLGAYPCCRCFQQVLGSTTQPSSSSTVRHSSSSKSTMYSQSQMAWILISAISTLNLSCGIWDISPIFGWLSRPTFVVCVLWILAVINAWGELLSTVRFERRAVRDASKWLLLACLSRKEEFAGMIFLAQIVLLNFCSSERVTAKAFMHLPFQSSIQNGPGN